MKLAGIALLMAAAVLLVWGLDASGSFNSEVSRFFRGTPTDRTAWLFVGSAVAGVIGFGLLYSRGTHKA